MSVYHKIAGVDHLDRLALGDSPVHHLHPRVKILTTLIYSGVVISFPVSNVSGLVPLVLYPCLLMSISGTPVKSILSRFCVSLPFALMGGISSLILLREPVFYVGPCMVTAGMLSFTSILLKTFLTVSAVLILIATTGFSEINWQLTRMGMPKILGLQFVMTWRYITVLLGEAAAMSTAYKLRASGQNGIKMKDMGSFLGQLLLRSFERAERVYQSMKCRGFTGVFPGAPGRSLRAADFIYAAALIGALVFLRFFNASVFAGRMLGRLGGKF
jgi:cobalt/nickel transport system permease protein